MGENGDAPVAYPDYILSYALVLRRVAMGVEGNTYRRVGLVQLDYLWLKEAPKTVVKLV